MNHRILAAFKAGAKEIALCVGSDRMDLSKEDELADIIKQLEVSFNGITAAQLRAVRFILAFDPAGKIGSGQGEDPEKVLYIHQGIYDWFENRYKTEDAAFIKDSWGKNFKLLYGASVDDTNARDYIALKSTREGMAGTQMVHGFLFASFGKKVENFLAVAKILNYANDGKGNRFVCFVNLKSFTSGKTVIQDFVGGIYAAGINKSKVIIAVADQDQYLAEWEQNIRELESYHHGDATEAFNKLDDSSLKLDGGLVVRGMDKLITVIADKAIKSGVVLLDLNTPMSGDQIEDDAKIRKSVPVIIKMEKESGQQFFFGFSHFTDEVKAGAFDRKFSLAAQAVRLQELLKESGSNVEVVLLPYDLDEAARVVAEKKAAAGTGKIFFLFENVRMYEGEQSDDPEVRLALENKYLAVTGDPAGKLSAINEAFEKCHRGKEASMELFTRLIPAENRAAGFSLKVDVDQLLAFDARRSPTGSFNALTGGSKFKKYSDFGAVAKLVAKTKGIMFMFGAQANPFLKSLGINIGASKMPTKEKDLKKVEKGLKKMGEAGATIVTPDDFVLKGPDGVMPGYYSAIKDGTMQVDIGEKTKSRVVEYIDSLKAGDAFVANGGAGVFEKPESYAGTEAIVLALHRAADRDVAVLEAGSDMDLADKLVQKNVRENPDKYPGVVLSNKVQHTLGGGVVWAAVGDGPLALSPIAGVVEDASAVDGGKIEAIAKAINMPVTQVQAYFSADCLFFRAARGELFRNFYRELLFNEDLDAQSGRTAPGRVFMVPTSYFRIPGAVTALTVASQLNKKLKIVVYGEKARILSQLIQGGNVVATDNAQGAIAALGAVGMGNNVIQIQDLAGRDSAVDSLLRANRIRQIVSDQPMIAIPKAEKETVRTEEADWAFAGYYKSLADTGAVAPAVYEKTKSVMLARLDDLTLEMPSIDISAGEQMKAHAEQAVKVTTEFIDKL